jgi:ATP-dependent Lhr-like helicase
LWQQRQRAAQLLEVASQYPSFPIVLEAVRECVNDVFDVPALAGVLRAVRSREIAVVSVETPRASPFAASLLFGYVAQFLYEGDSPLAEKRAAALALDPSLLADLLGTSEGLALADLLDPEALTRTEAELQGLAEGRRARDADELGDLLRTLGPLTAAELAARSADPEAVTGWLADLEAAHRVIAVRLADRPCWAAVEDAGRLRDGLGVPLPMGVPQAFTDPVDDPLGELLGRYARTHAPFTLGEAAGWLGLGHAVARDVLRRLVGSGRLVEGELRPPGWVGTGAGYAAGSVAGPEEPTLRQGALPGAAAAEPEEPTLRQAQGSTTPEPAARPDDPTLRQAQGAFPGGAAQGALPPGATPGSSTPGSSTLGPSTPGSSTLGPSTPGSSTLGPSTLGQSTLGAAQFCDARVLRLLRRRSLAALRDATEPVATGDFARFLPSWQGFGELRGVEGTYRAVEQLAGLPVPASALEALILPARVRDYRPALLDELTAGGDVLWQGHGSLGGGDGWVSLHPAELAGATLAPPGAVADELAGELLAALSDGGGHFFRALADRLEAERAASDRPGVLDDGRLTAALWGLVWAGLATNDTLVPLRALLGQAATTHRTRPAGPTRSRYGRGLRGAVPRRPSLPQAAGRWSALPEPVTDPTIRAAATAEVLLNRYGVVTRGSVAAEEVPGGFAGVYRVLAAAEEAGRLRRGYFVERLGAAQFAALGAVDRLRGLVRPVGTDPPGKALVLAACDPANPYGAALPWPQRETGGTGRGHQPGRKAGALVVLVDGDLVLYVERGGRTLLSWSDQQGPLTAAATALAAAVHSGALGTLTVAKVDGEAALGSGHPLALALEAAGFRLTPRGLRLRR